jgi:hypothetical protein
MERNPARLHVFLRPGGGGTFAAPRGMGVRDLKEEGLATRTDERQLRSGRALAVRRSRAWQ